MATNLVRSVSHFLKSNPNSSMDEFTAHILSVHYGREIRPQQVTDMVHAAAQETGGKPFVLILQGITKQCLA